MHSTSVITELVLSVHVGIFGVWILMPDIMNKYKCSPMSIGIKFVVMNY